MGPQLSNDFLFCVSSPDPSERPAGSYHKYSNNVFIFFSGESIDMCTFNKETQ